MESGCGNKTKNTKLLNVLVEHLFQRHKQTQEDIRTKRIMGDASVKVQTEEMTVKKNSNKSGKRHKES